MSPASQLLDRSTSDGTKASVSAALVSAGLESVLVEDVFAKLRWLRRTAQTAGRAGGTLNSEL